MVYFLFNDFTSCSQVYAPDEETYVGRVTKQWSGLGKELFTDADNFGISFPLDLDVNVKATLLGAVFLLVSVTLSINFTVYREMFAPILISLLSPLLSTGKFQTGQIQKQVLNYCVI